MFSKTSTFKNAGQSAEKEADKAKPFFTSRQSPGTPFFSAAPTSVQPKLTINAPGDKYEQEADEMAERVVQAQSIQRQTLPEEEKLMQAKPLEGATVQRKCASCEQEATLQRQAEPEEEELMQAKPLMRASENGTATATPQLASQLNSSKGGGQPLPKDTLSSMNQAFGTDFSNVRVHTGSRAQEMSQGIQARAFTHGSDIFFNRGEYNPGSTEGKRLLGHELTHVVQQGGATGNALGVIQKDDELAPEKDPPKTKLETVAEHDLVEKKTAVKSKISTEEKVSDAVTKTTSATVSDKGTEATAEVKAEDKGTGLSTAAGVTGKSDVDPSKPDTAEFYVKVAGKWKLFKSPTFSLQTGTQLKLSSLKGPVVSVDGKAILFPKNTFSPYLAASFVAQQKGVAGQGALGFKQRLTQNLFLQSSLMLGLSQEDGFQATVNAGVVLEF